VEYLGEASGLKRYCGDASCGQKQSKKKKKIMMAVQARVQVKFFLNSQWPQEVTTLSYHALAQRFGQELICERSAICIWGAMSLGETLVDLAGNGATGKPY
jgi:hypothetical protein